MRFLPLILASFFLIVSERALAQENMDSQQPVSNFVHYRCKKGKTFQVEFLKGTAQLTLKNNQTYSLKQVPSASGGQYTNGKINLYTKEDSAFIEINQKMMYDNCTTKPQDLSKTPRYNCDSQVAPYPNKESMTLEQAEKLLLERDGNLFIYHCYPQ